MLFVTARIPEDNWTLGSRKDHLGWLPAGLVTLCFPTGTYPIKITVGVMFRDSRPDGMPAETEHQFLGDLEEALISDLAERNAQLVLVVTSQGAREWVPYTDSVDWLKDWAPRFADVYLRPRRHDINAVLDDDWATYRAFTA